ncbi:MAG: hypothetical protein NZ483_08875, partial [Verrucomicrobiae bacterium]|nr:hypothetical protein [Verrucomicrobiae bacterium]
MNTFLRISIVGVLSVLPAAQGQFIIDGASNTPQTVSSGTGLITTNGMLTVTGSAVAITMSGTSIVTNFGTVQQTGTGRAIRNTAVGANLTIYNETNALISASAQDAVQTANSAIRVLNHGTITAAGGQALDLRDILTQPNVVINYSTGHLLATGEDAVRPGVSGIITNYGVIRATPVSGSGSDGVDAGVNSNVRVYNAGTIQGRHGITGGATTYAITIHNDAGGLLRGVNGSGVNIDGVAATSTATVRNEAGGVIEGLVDATSANGDGDGVDVDGVVTLHNAGIIRGFGAKGVDSGGNPNNAEAVAIGGGSIVNTASGQIIGSTLLSDAPNTNPSRQGNGILADNGAGGSAVAATTIDNAGLIRGKTGFGIKLVGNFADQIINQAGGVIQGANAPGGASLAVIQTGGGDDLVINRGHILHDAGMTETALALEAGNDTLRVEGGVAVITGNVDGGAGNDAVVFDLGAGNSFAYAGTLSNFEQLSAVSGTTDLNGNAPVAGAATVAAGATLRVNGTLGATGLAVSGTLGGNGTVQAPTTMNAGSALKPGSSIGTLVIDDDLDLTAAVNDPATGALEFELGSLPHHDKVLTDSLKIGIGKLEFDDFQFTDLGITLGSYVLFASETPIVGTLGANLTGTISGYSATLALANGNHEIVLHIIPEPGTATLTFGAVALLAVFRLRRRAS